MKVLKASFLGFLSFLLFLSLSAFGMVFTLHQTVLSPDFMFSEVSRLNISTLVRQVTEPQLTAQLTPELQFLKEPLYGAIAFQEPWLKEQARAGIYTAYDFLEGRSARLALSISLDTLKASIKDRVRQAFLQQLPPQLSSLPPAQIEQYFNQYYDQFAQQIPSKIDINESNIPADIMTQLRQARQYCIDYFSLAFYGLIGLMVLLALGIVLVHFQVRGASRELGITLLSYGALEYVGVLLAKQFNPLQMVSGLPPSLQTWLPQLFNDLFAPLAMFSLGCAVGGVVLLVVSFVYPKREEGGE